MFSFQFFFFIYIDPQKSSLGASDSKELKKNEKLFDSEDKTPVVERTKKPWHALVSYVDELTIGRRRDSQGNYINSIEKFPGFGRNRKNKTPQDCFPRHCYQR